MRNKKLFKLDNLWMVLIYGALLFLGFICLYPFWVMIVGSITSPETYYASRGLKIIPTELYTGAYTILFSYGWDSPVVKGYIVTILETVIGTTMNIVATATMSYALSRKNLPGKKVVLFFLYFTTLFGGGLIPSYLLKVSLGFTNNFWVYIIPGLYSAWNIIILRNFFMTIPQELEESAKIDGASNLRVFLQIALPLSGPGLATMTLFFAVGHWNQWFDAMLYMRDRDQWPLQMLMREIVVMSDTSRIKAAYVEGRGLPTFAVRCATTMVTTVPILVLYPFLQRYFVKGMMVGSIKG